MDFRQQSVALDALDSLACDALLVIVAGEVAYTEEPLDSPEPGKLLLCCSRPLGPVTVRF